jgi:hypothetical protein
MDERVVPALRDFLKQHPSAEFEQRVDIIARRFEQQPIPPLAAYVIERAKNYGGSQADLIFEAISGPPNSCRLSDLVQKKKLELEKTRQAGIERRLSAERQPLAQQKAPGPPDAPKR